MSTESSEKNKSWLERIANTFSSEPQTKKDLIAFLHEANDNHLLNHEALKMMEGVLQVSEMQVRDIMIPRAQMMTIEQEQTLDDILPIIIESGHSRFPVINADNHDKIIGTLLAKDLLRFTKTGAAEKFDLQTIIRPVTFIPESKRLDVLLKEFKDKHSHMAIVVDEYGGIAGLITIEDVLEQIVGDIEDEFDLEEENPIRKLSDTAFHINPLLPIEDFNEYFKSQFTDEEFDTIGGLVLHAFGHLPKQGEQTDIENFHFTVINADSRRIKMLKLVI